MAQLKSTNVTGNLSVTGNILASKIIKIGGTPDQILMADGETTKLSDILGKLNAAVILKGTLGTDGTIQALPAASATVLGHAYKVITKGTYDGITAKVGDMFICYETGASAYAWMHIPSGDDIENTWRPIKLEGTQILTNGTSSNPLNFKQGANITITNNNGDLTIAADDSTYGADRGISLVNGNFGHSNTAVTAKTTKGLYKISYDAYGHITGSEAYTDQNTTYSFTGGTDCFTVTPSGGSAQTVNVVNRRISSPDTRSDAIGPDGIVAGVQFDFKSGATVSHPTTAVNKYVGVMTWKSYGGSTDYSGGGPLQLSYDEAGVLWTRLGSRTAWGDWHKIATIEDVTSISGAYLPLAGGTMNADAVITLPNSARIVHQTKTSSNYVVDAVWYKGSSAVSSGYDAQIGWHNTGDTDGAIIILPHNTTTDPWSSSVGLYISKTRLKYNNINVSLEGHGHTNMVTGSDLTANNIVVGNNNSAVKISTASVNSGGQVIASGFGDGTITIKPHASNEINFGGTNTGTTIYFGHQGVDSRPKPVHYQFGGVAGDAMVQAKGFIKTGSDDTFVLLAGGGHKALSDFTTGGGAIGDYVTLTTPQTISGVKTFSAQPLISTADGLKFTNGNCSLRIYNTSASPTDYSAIEVRSNAATTNRNLFIDLANNSLVVGTPSGTADTTYKVKIVGTLGVTGQLTSTVTTGTAPLVVGSTTKVTNLNADRVDGCDIETTLTYNSDTAIPTSKAVADYVVEQKTADVYWADQSVTTTGSINTEPTFKSIKISDGGTTVKARWTYNSASECVELVWE